MSLWGSCHAKYERYLIWNIYTVSTLWILRLIQPTCRSNRWIVVSRPKIAIISTAPGPAVLWSNNFFKMPMKSEYFKCCVFEKLRKMLTKLSLSNFGVVCSICVNGVIQLYCSAWHSDKIHKNANFVSVNWLRDTICSAPAHQFRTLLIWVVSVSRSPVLFMKEGERGNCLNSLGRMRILKLKNKSKLTDENQKNNRNKGGIGEIRQWNKK